MGCYVNPKSGTKEDWLLTNAIAVSENYARATEPGKDGYYVVVLVDNGPFKAAGVAYSARELADFTDPTDDRPKQFYLATLDDLKTVSDIERYIRNG